MRLRLTLIALSLAANTAFGLALWQRRASGVSESRAHGDSSTTSPSSSASARSATNADPAEIPATAIWSYLTADSTDDTTLIARLRAEGFPKNIIRLIIQQRVRERFSAEYRALADKDADSPYWIRHNYSRTSPESRAARRALDSQVSAAVRSLLGPDADKQPGEPGYDDPRRLYGDIPAEKISQLEAINKDYGELTAAIRDATLGITLPEDREKLRFLENEKRADLAALLSPDELEQYDIRNSPAAREVRTRTRNFDATESEFLALYRIQSAFDQKHGALSESSSSRERTQRNDARKELDAQIAAALSPNRYAEYQLTTHTSYGITNDFVTSAGLPPATTRSLVALQTDIDRQRNALRSDRSLDKDQRAAALAELQKTATEKVTAIIGAEHLDTYKTRGGFWLRNLAPSTSAPVTTP
jgi:hypothetical protein